MAFSLSYHRPPKGKPTPGAAATACYIVVMFLLMALVESACSPMISHASVHQGEGFAWLVLGVAVYQLGSKYHYPNGALMLGLASPAILMRRYFDSAPVRRAIRCGVEPPELGETLVGVFVMLLVIGTLAWLMANAVMVVHESPLPNRDNESAKNPDFTELQAPETSYNGV